MLLASWVLYTATPLGHVQSQQPAPAASAKKALTADEVQTLNRLHASNLKEIKAGELAKKRARNETVKRYGELLIKHHTEADREVKAIAASAGVKLTEPNTDLGELEKVVSPANFDRDFVTMMAKDHGDAIAQVEADQPKAVNPELQALLKKTLPMLRQHRDQAVRQVQNNPF
jgi:putative membrane protein